MAHKKRGLEGNQAAAKGGAGTTGDYRPTWIEPMKGDSMPAGAGRDNRKHAKFWVSHRMGPFLVHDNQGDCQPERIDNVGYLDSYENAIAQGFAPCPKCSPGGAE